MLEYAEKLTMTPAAMNEEDIESLRVVGWTDRDILDIAHVSAYFNFRVRMVDGLGLDAPEQSVERAVERRERAAVMAKEKGIALPADIWDVAGMAESAKVKAKADASG